jgi:hypothetical protein
VVNLGRGQTDRDAATSQVFTHLAAGLRMVGPGMADLDPEQAEFDLQGDAALAALFDGEDGSVVGQHAVWGSPLAKGCAEVGYHVAALGDSPGIGGQAESGMVVDDVEDSEPEGARRGVSGRKDGFFLDTCGTNLRNLVIAGATEERSESG